MPENDGMDWLKLEDDPGAESAPDVVEDDEEEDVVKDDDEEDDEEDEVESEAEGDGEGEDEEDTPQPVDLNVDPITGRQLKPEHIAAQLHQYKTTVVPALQREYEKFKARNEQLESEVAGLKEYDTVIKSHGLTPKEAAISAYLGSLMKTDPARAAQEVLAAVQAKGVQLPENLQGTVNYTAIEQAFEKKLEQRFGPLLKQFEAAQSERDADAKLNTEIEQFFDANPIAEVHKGMLADILDRAPHLGIPGAWKQIQLYAQQRGLNLAAPLGQKNPAEAIRNRPSRNIGSPRQSASQPVAQADEMFGVNESYNDIFDPARQIAMLRRFNGAG